jgi:hypothetical protein
VASPATARSTPYDRRFRIQFAALFAVAVGAIAIIIYGVFGTDDAEVVVAPAEIESYSPVDGAIETSQITITVDLRDDYSGALIVDGVEIPLDQTQGGAAAIGVLTYRPTADSATGELQPGPHRVAVEYWPTTQPRATSSRTFRWEFRTSA